MKKVIISAFILVVFSAAACAQVAKRGKIQDTNRVQINTPVVLENKEKYYQKTYSPTRGVTVSVAIKNKSGAAKKFIVYVVEQ